MKSNAKKVSDEILSKMSNEEKKKKIKEEDLSTISGGCGKKPYDPHTDYNFKTKMLCRVCQNSVIWDGNYLNDGIAYECPQCNNMALFGWEHI